MMDSLVSTPLFGIFTTLAIWLVARRIRAAAGTPMADPVLISVAAIILLLTAGGLDYERTYSVSGRYLTFLLGPAVVALAVPLYRSIEKVRHNLAAIAAGVRGPFAVGLAVGTASHGIGTARMLRDDELAGAMSGIP
ncbi:MAG TPA: LrgB family protein [Planctomycetota bacterium]|nr:LrgB family protein [Planctomycetota bacterium]